MCEPLIGGILAKGVASRDWPPGGCESVLVRGIELSEKRRAHQRTFRRGPPTALKWQAINAVCRCSNCQGMCRDNPRRAQFQKRKYLLLTDVNAREPRARRAVRKKLSIGAEAESGGEISEGCRR